MLRGDPPGGMPIASGSPRRLLATRTGPLPQMVRPLQVATPGAAGPALVPQRP